MKTLRRLLIVLGILLVLAAVVFEGGRRLLASQYLANKVAARLAKVYGGPLKLTTLDLGTQGTSLHGLQLFPMGSDPSDSSVQPWIKVDEVDADVTLWDALRGKTALHQLTLKGASISLHFDKDGRLLTKLPKAGGDPTAVPAVHVERGVLILSQDGRPPMALEGIHCDLDTVEGALILTGGLDDQRWGDWEVKASWDQKTGQGSATLSCVRTTLTQAKLAEVPFVPPSVWREVNGVEGDTRVTLDLSTFGPSNNLHYSLTLNPIKASVHVSSIDLTGELTGGAIAVKDNLVELRKIVGQTADGQVNISGELDFRNAKKTELQFDIEAKRLVLEKLPARWDLPRQITGKLDGKATLQLTIVDAQVHTSGEGHAVINDARLAGMPARPIELRLHPTGQGFRFASPGTAALERAPALALLANLLVARQDPEPLDWLVELPGRITDGLAGGVHVVADSLLKAGQKWQSLLPKRAIAAPANLAGYLEINLGLDNVDLAALINNLGVQLPITVAGKISFDLQAAIPTNTPKDLKAYRLNGTAALSWLTVEGLRLEQVQARVAYADGILRLEELKSQVPETPRGAGEPPAPRGNVEGKARLELFPAKDLTAQVTLRRMPLTRLASLVPGAAERAGGDFSGALSLRAPAEKLRDVKTWEATSSILSEHLELYGIKLDSLSAQMKLREGKLSVSDLKGNLEGGSITGSAGLTLAGVYDYQGVLDLSNVDLGMMQRLAPNPRVPLAVGGRLTLNVEARGTLHPFTVTAKGNAGAKDLAVEKVKVTTLGFAWESNGKQLTLADLRVALYGGEVTGRAALPLLPKETGTVDLRFAKVDLGSLLSNLPPLPVRLEGKADGTLKATVPALTARGQREWATDMNLQSRQLKLQGIPAQKVTGAVEYKLQAIEYRFQGDTLGGTFRVEGKVPVPPLPGGKGFGGEGERPASVVPQPKPTGELQGSIRFEHLRLIRIWEFLGLEKVLDPLRGSISVALDYRANGAGRPEGRGTFEMINLRWNGTRFFQDVVPGFVVLDGQQLRFGFSSSELGGLVRANAEINLGRPERSSFEFTIERVNLTRLLAPWPEYLPHYRGDLVVQLRGRLGRSWFGSGAISLVGGAVYGIELNEWRLPVEMTYSPLDRQGQITVHDSTLQFLVGRGTGQATFNWGGTSRLEGHMNFFNVEIRHLMQTSELGRYGSGLLSGKLDFGGTDLQSPGDITANLDATLKQTQALQFPVLQQLTPFLLGNLSSATIFQDGSLRARLTRGTLRIERLALQSRTARLFLDGTVTVPEGRLDLDATVSTGVMALSACFQPLVRGTVGSANPIPVALLRELSNRIGNLALKLHVTGTYRGPTIQVQPFRQLSEKALRFLAL